MLGVAACAVNTDVDALRDPSPEHELVKARDVIFALLTKQFGFSQPDAGAILNRETADVVRAMARMWTPDAARRELLQQVCMNIDVPYFEFMTRLKKRKRSS